MTSRASHHTGASNNPAGVAAATAVQRYLAEPHTVLCITNTLSTSKHAVEFPDPGGGTGRPSTRKRARPKPHHIGTETAGKGVEGPEDEARPEVYITYKNIFIYIYTHKHKDKYIYSSHDSRHTGRRRESERHTVLGNINNTGHDHVPGRPHIPRWRTGRPTTSNSSRPKPSTTSEPNHLENV